jgi:hypothetical protein
MFYQCEKLTEMHTEVNTRAVESESEGILGAVGVGVGRNFRCSRSLSRKEFLGEVRVGVRVGVGENVPESVKMYRLRLRPQSKILTRYSNSRALIATVTIRLILKCRL